MSPTESISPLSHYQRHCPGCFQFKGGAAACPHCGYDEAAPRSALFLPHGITLGGQYRVGRVLGRPGGFGITYLGWDINLQQRVAIKEYLPREICTRSSNSLDVHVHTADDKRGFDFGKEQFLREARIVAKLDHPNIVRVRNFFNANATAYLVMDYYEGMSLGDYVSSVRAKLEPEIAVPLFQHILEGLQYVHERGLVHRDLKPHNIYLAAVGRPIVLDFGAARQAAGDRVQSLSVVLTEGYAPLEQYQRRAVQGPWTDVYGTAATLYRVLVGSAPPIALDRIGRDPIEEGNWAGLPPRLVETFKRALAVRPNERYQSAEEFRQALELAYPDGSLASVPEAEVQAMPPALRPVKGSMAANTAPRPAIAGTIGSGAPAPAGNPSLTQLLDATLETVARVPVDAKPVEALPAIPDFNATNAFDLAAEPVSVERAEAYAAAVVAAPPLGVLAEALPGNQSSANRNPRQAAAGGSFGSRAANMPWVALVLISLAVFALGYVLLNPPGRQAASASPEPSPMPYAGQSPPPRPDLDDTRKTPAAAAAVNPESLAAPTELPVLVSVPGGRVNLVEEGGSRTAGGSLFVEVAPLDVGITEITVAQFAEFVRLASYHNPFWQNYPCESAGGRLPEWDKPGYQQGDNYPVVCVSWADAKAYTEWLSRISHAVYRLPTEAEWQYLASGQRSSRYWWGNDFKPAYATCQSCPPKVPAQPTATQTYPANPFGLFEVLGNVREWTCSAYQPLEKSAARSCTAAEPAEAAVRGGSWQQPEMWLSLTQRDHLDPNHRDVWTGFRVVREIGR